MFWNFFFRLLIASFIAPFVFAFLMLPVMGLALVLGLVKGKTQKFIQYPILFIIGILTLYVYGMWSAFCSSTVLLFSSLEGVKHVWLYHFVGFTTCTSLISFLANKESTMAQSSEEYYEIRRDAGIHALVPIVGYIVFSIWPRVMGFLYGWFLNWIY